MKKTTIRTKIAAIALSAITAASVGAIAFNSVSVSAAYRCSEEKAVMSVENVQTTDIRESGAFVRAESTIVTDEIKNLVQKATSGLGGAEYTPVAYIASQVVAGTNHLILCKITPVVPNAVGHYALVTIYEKFNGDAEILEIKNSNKEVPPTDEDGRVLAGSFCERENPEITTEDKAILTKACESRCGADYEPVAMISEQIVAGKNYRILCKITPVIQNPKPYYAIVTVYADLNGNAEITETVDFTA